MSENKRPPGFNVDIARHTTSDYKNYLRKEHPDADPNEYVDYRDQVTDVNEEGKELAKENAEAYAQTIDPEKELVVVVSSGEMRAYQTAQIYIDALEARGVEIFAGVPSQQDKERYPVGPAAEVRGTPDEPEIDTRIVASRIPSLNYEGMWVEDMLEPPAGSKGTTFEGLDESKLSEEDRARYQLARSVIETKNDTDASWGSNYVEHEGKPYPFDVIPSVADNHQKMMRGIRLLRRLHEMPKTREFEKDKGKQIRYLVFTHEENMLGMARSHFGVSRVENCDVIQLHVPEDRDSMMGATHKGTKKQMADLFIHDKTQQQRRGEQTNQDDQE